MQFAPDVVQYVPLRLPVIEAILLIGSAVVVWARRHQLFGDQPTVR